MLSGATAVATSSDMAVPKVLETIGNLVAKSLVTADVTGSIVLYRLLDSTRAYALEKLKESGESEALSRRHAEYFRDLLEQAATEFTQRSTADWMATTYSRQIDDVRTALNWAFSPSGNSAIAVRLTIAAVPMWMQLSLLEECGVRAEQATFLLGHEPGHAERQHMQLWTALGVSMTHKIGPNPKIIAAWTSVLEFAERLGDTDYKLRALWGLWVIRINGGEYRAGLETARQFADVAATRAQRSEQLIGSRLIGNYLGELSEARQQIEHMLNEYVPPYNRYDLVHYQFDQRVAAGVILARILWTQGFAERGMQAAKNSLQEALRTNHALSICISLALGICPVALAGGDLEEAQRCISLLLDYSRRHSLDYWYAWAHAYDAVLIIQRKNPNGLGALEAALDGTTTGSRFAQNFLPFLAILAETFVSDGNLEKASAAIDRALERCERDEAYWFIAEILRVKALVALPHDPGKAEEYFLRSLEYARNQQALAWELRTTISVAQARRGQGRTDEARNMLASLYARFNEGFETADLRAAKRLLDELR